ncbi:hypothetical protein I6N90_08230 [Paenibacillus sp. GSMTC-2017]|uniref:hypothetical protein n=1 Tax=Paenibacillus sp. GSMTC-2017 TaxID=2794350 RepID=UPI0018D7A73F|nr:hypothetical protein [Paenibacillus sp. GSMTC-2017]MBH5317790.1 hypothetical protein [Paenibacillus sp. GSMTC-2017]
MSTELLYGLMFFLLGLPTSYLINVNTPRIRDWFSLRSINKSNKRKKVILKELEYIETLASVPNGLVGIAFIKVFHTISFLAAGISLYFYFETISITSSSMSLYFPIMKLTIALAIYAAGVYAMDAAKQVRQIMFFDIHKKKTLKRIETIENSIKSLTRQPE